MTEQEIVRLLSTIKMKVKSTVADETWGKALQLIEQLQSENAALKERLDKAIEPPKPFIEQDRDGYYRVYSSRISIIRYDKQYGIYGTIEAAEARLKELKGEEE